MINIVGLGAGDLMQLPLAIYKLLTTNDTPLFLRTAEHPITTELEELGITGRSFDDIYEKHTDFSSIYESITNILIESENDIGEIIYAVPGHPLVAEETVQILLKKIPEKVTIVGGHSFLDYVFTSLQLDPVNGFQLADALTLSSTSINITIHLVITQIYDQYSASQAKLTLLEKYPPDHKITILSQAGLPTETKKILPLYELDHNWQINNQAVVYVPPAHELKREFWYLCNIFAKLRSKTGCPWDQAQTHETLLDKFQEELDEYKEAVKNEDIPNVIEELGDLLLHIVLSAQIGKDEDLFTIEDVIETLSSKMINRHPHVFDNAKATTPEEALKLFKQAKKNERKQGDN